MRALIGQQSYPREPLALTYQATGNSVKLSLVLCDNWWLLMIVNYENRKHVSAIG